MKKLTGAILALVFSSSISVVYAQEKKSDTIKSIEIEGVVITSLGIKREKRALGYAAQEVKGELISDAGQTNAVSSLSGNVAGVQVTAPSSMGGSTRITMRGISSIIGENRPLIVVDGIPLDNSNTNDLSTQRGAGGRDYGDASFDINPNDIESVTVLKGGPAAALYGSRAANGVILYTTKSAKRGRTEVQFNTGVSFESIYIYPKLQDHYGGGFGNLKQVTINGKAYNVANYSADESWGPKYDPNLMYLPWNAFDPEFANDYMKEIPWVAPKRGTDQFFGTGVTTTNNLSISKSFENVNVRLSYTNTKIEGILPNSNLKKDNLSFNANSKLSDKLKAEGQFNYALVRGFNRPEQGYGNNSVAQKFSQWGQRQLDMSALRDYKTSIGTQRTWNRRSWDDANPVYSDNPYWTVYENVSNDKRHRFFGNAGLTYQINDQLYAVGKVYGDVYSLDIDSRVAVGSRAISNFSVSKRNVSEYNFEGRMHFDTHIGQDISLNSFFGVNRRQNRMSWMKASTVGGLVIPNLYNLDNGEEASIVKNHSEQQRVNSAYGSISLGFKDIAYLEATGRKDWFSTVEDNVFYPSVTGSFVFSSLVKFQWLSFGKLRAGWAEIGLDTQPYKLLDYVNIGKKIGDDYYGVPFQGVPMYSTSNTLNNPDLKPETKTTKEIGLEMRLFKSRVGFDVTYYDTTSRDLIIPLPIDPSTGYEYAMVNAGKMKNKGIEASVFVTPINTSAFKWDINWNFAKNSNEVKELAGGVDTYVLTKAPFRVQLVAEVGQKYGQIKGTDFVYNEHGERIVGNDGLYLASEVKTLGSILPDYNMGIRNSFKMNNFSLSFLIDIQKGGKYFSTSHMFGMSSGMLEESGLGGNREQGVILDGVKQDGSRNDVLISAMDWGGSYYNTVDAQNIFDASYIKLREITLGYDLPKSVIGDSIQGVRISAFARNLFAWNLDWKGMDPENTSYGSGNSQGLEGGSAPSTRTYGFNVSIKF